MSAKHALIVGVNRYARLEDKYQLRGCVNDAILIRNLLVEQFGFEAGNVRELHDGAASADAIRVAMEELVDMVGTDDVVVFHFSGHGRRRRSKSLDEGVGKDSGIMPADSGCKEENRDIRDDDINEWLGRLSQKTRYITLIFDCCFSGTVTRDAAGAAVRAVEEDVWDGPGTGDRQMPDGDAAAPSRKGPGGFLPLSERYVVLSGCRDDEKAKEFTLEQGKRSSRNGALTYYLTRALLAARPGSTYRDVFEIAAIGVSARFPTQHPQIEGTQDREIFGMREFEPMRYVPVVAVDGNEVTLGGGAAHGLHCDTRWMVYPRGTKYADASKPLGEVEIREVGSLTSDAAIVDSASGIDVGARCVQKSPFSGQHALQVDLRLLPENARAALAARIDSSNLLTVATGTEVADVRACILEPRARASSGDPMPHIPEVRMRSWALVNLDSELALPLVAADQENVIDLLVHNLETAARYRNALKLENPGSRLDVRFDIFKVLPSGELEPANRAGFEFDDGERLAFEVANNERVPVFVSIVNFGLNGQIKVLYPRRRSSELIAPGITIRKAAGRTKLRVNLDGFDGDYGVQTYKAFIATAPVDFSWLLQDAARATTQPASPLDGRFRAACNGVDTRASWDDEDAPEDGDADDWIAVNRSIAVRRRKS